MNKFDSESDKHNLRVFDSESNKHNCRMSNQDAAGYTEGWGQESQCPNKFCDRDRDRDRGCD
jgi:hypothetical protein